MCVPIYVGKPTDNFQLFTRDFVLISNSCLRENHIDILVIDLEMGLV